MSILGKWERVRVLFQAALGQPEENRDAFLTTACKGDEALRREVRSLLEAHVAAGAFLETPVVRFGDRALAQPAPALQPGDRIGHFHVMSTLGVGGMGEVYRARDLQLGREVAIKVLPPTFAASRQRLARFERESRILASLNHPNIASIYSVQQLEALRLLVLELIEGPTLADRLHSGPLPVAQALAIARQLAAALRAAHERGIVHRDLTPANVKLSPSGVVKLLDFGLAKEGGWFEDGRPAAGDAPRTTEGLILGTCAYMSPEQARGQPVDSRTDVWAFGCILFELLTGRRAFPGETPSDALAAVLERQPDWALLPEETPLATRALIRQCLEKDAGRRLPDIDAASIHDPDLMQPDADVLREHSSATRKRNALGWLDRWALMSASVKLRARLLALGAVAALVASVWIGDATHRSRPLDSLAILPFGSTPGDPELEYLGDGLAESLINELSGVDTLRVVQRTTAFRYRGRDGDAVKIAKQLNVRTVLTGRVTQQGDSIVVQVDLIDGANNARLWSRRFERGVGDLVTVQREIARGIWSAMRLPLRGTDTTLLDRRATPDSEAYRLYLKGLYHWNKDTRAGYQSALEHFSAAIGRDPRFALAHTGVAMVHYNRVATSGMALPSEAMPLALAAVDRALALDDRLAETYTVRGIVRLTYDWDVAAAERDIRRALALNPHLPLAHGTYGFWLTTLRRMDEAIAAVKRWVELDPLSLKANTELAAAYVMAGRFPEAFAQIDETLALDGYRSAHFIRSLVLHAAGRFDEALEERVKYLRLGGDEAGAALFTRAAAQGGYQAAWLAYRDRLLERSRASYVSPMVIAYAAALGGDVDNAFEYLERAYTIRQADMVQLHVNLRLAHLRNDPRFMDLVRRVGVDPAMRR